MGLVKILLVSAAGVWSARAVSRLSHQVKRVPAPQLSSLVQYADRRQDFYADAFVLVLPDRVAYSNIPIRASDVARSFFSSKLFSSVEKPLLKLVFSLKEPLINHCHFYPGDQVLVWTVTERNREEVLLEWNAGSFRGFTWLFISPDQKYVMLGSSIGYTGLKTHLPLNTDVSPSSIISDSYRRFTHNPYEEPILRRIVNAIGSVTFSAVIWVHQLYSRLLLKSTLKTLVLEEK